MFKIQDCYGGVMLKLRMVVLVAVVFDAGFLATRILWSSPAPSAATPMASTMLMGTTRAAGGRVLEGVTVSARAVNGTITTSVYSDAKGNYYFQALPGGRYRVWAQAVGYEAGRAELNLDPARETRQDFSLKITKDFTKQLSTFEWIAALPEDTRENLRLKQIFSNACTGCHPGSFVLQNRFDEAGWRAILERMETIDNVYGGTGPINPAIQHYKGELAPYLAKMRGPSPSPMKFKPYPRPKGDAARVVVTEYAVAWPETPDEFIDQDGSDWSQGVPSAIGARGLHDVAVDLNGKVWVTNGKENRAQTFLKLDPEAGKVTNFLVPGGPLGLGQWSHGIKTDPSGIIWLTVTADHARPGVTLGNGGPSSLVRVDPKTGEFRLYNPPPGMGGVGVTVEVDPKGKVLIGSSGALTFDPATEKFAYYKALTPGVGGYGIQSDANGNIWFATTSPDIVGFADVKTGKVSEIRLPPRSDMMELSTAEDRKFDEQGKSGRNGFLPAQAPRRFGGGGKWGKYVWWPNWFGGSISKADINTHEVTFYPLPIPNSNPYYTNLDKNGTVWVALMGDERIAKFDPTTQQWTLYPLPSLGNEMRFITVDNSKDPVEVWTASYRTSKVIRLQFRTEEELAAADLK